SDFHRGDASPRALRRLDVGDGILTTIAQRAQTIELFIYTGTDRWLVANGEGRPLHDRRLNRLCFRGTIVPLADQAIEQRRRGASAELPNDRFDLGQPRERRPE